MNCPNCKKPFVAERSGKFQCVDCGWFEKVDNEWRVCSEPESSGSQTTEPESPQEPGLPTEPYPAALDPNPAALEPDPAKLEPSPEPQANVKEYLGGLLTVTEVDE